MGTNPEINLRDRDNMFLAKVAGEEVDFTTITPSIPVSDREKLLMKIDERIGAVEKTEEQSGSGGGVMIVTFSATMEDNELVISADKTLSELLEALEGGMICEGRLEVQDGADGTVVSVYQMLEYKENYARFIRHDFDGSYSAFTYTSDGVEYDTGSGGEE